MATFKRIVLDIETNGLFEHLIDFTKTPLRVDSDKARLWLVVFRDHETGEKIRLKGNDCYNIEKYKEILLNAEEIIFHNGVKYDAIVLKLFSMLDYKIYYHLDENNNNGEVFGKPIKITDTLLLSKFLYPDRFFGHSLDSWGRQLGDYKTNYRQVCIDAGYIDPKSPKGEEFKKYYPELDSYCDQDTNVTSTIYNHLLEEQGDADIKHQYHMELKLADLTVKQELHGFKFDKDKAEENLEKFVALMDDIHKRVDPILPLKSLNKGDQAFYTVPAKQFKANGDLTAIAIKFVQKIGGVFDKENSLKFTFNGEEFQFPLEAGSCLLKAMPSTIDDLDNLKAFVLSLGWNPVEWKERDLTKDAKKKKLSGDKLIETIKRYCKSTLEGPYKDARLQLLELTEDNLEETLLSKSDAFSLYVPVSPQLRIGVDKKLCPNLEKLGEKAEFVSDVVTYLTLKHRKNSIAGGKEDEEGSPVTGYLSNLRPDGRISTPADTIGAACVVGDTSITCKNTYKLITQIDIGDLVLTHTGQYKPVIDLINNGVKHVYEVILQDNKRVECTGNHPFYTDKGWIRCNDMVPNETNIFVDTDFGFRLSKLKSVTSIGLKPTYDLTVEDDHSYIANNIVTHNTTRYRHIAVANIPRVTSLFGEEMRSMFGVDHEKGRIEFAFDFSSLEAVVNGHYILPYPHGEEEARALTSPKPNDCFDMCTQILTRDGWKYYNELTEDTLIANWYEDKTITYTKAHNFVYRKTNDNKMISIVTDRINIRVTDNHRINLYDVTNNKYIVILAGDLKEYLSNNSNIDYRIPANGISYVEKEFNIDLDNIEMMCDKFSCTVYKSYNKETIMDIITNQRLKGSSSFLITKERNGKSLYQTSIGKQPLNVNGFKLTSDDVKIENDVDEYVWCVSVPSERVIIRRNDCISITMNCHCLPSTNKVLTKDRGWVTFTELQKGEPIAQWSDGIISYEVPDEIIIQSNTKPLYNFSNSNSVSMTVTPNHRVVLKHIASGKYVTKLAEEVKGLVGSQAYTIPLTALNSNPDLDLTDDFLKLLVAVQADGYFDKQGYCRLKFSKQRKIDRLTDILNNLNISPSLYENEREGTLSFTICKEATNQLKIYLREDKSFKDSLLHMSTRQANIFINEVQYWDGTLSPNSNIIYDVHDKVSRDFLHTLSSINGISSTANEYIKPNPFKPGEFRTIYRFLVSNSFLKPRNQNNPAKLNSIVFKEVEGVDEIACVSIKSSYFLCKEGDRIFVTGNSLNAINLWGDISKRGDAKSFGYACMYGAQPSKLAKIVSVSLSEGEDLFKKYWDGMPALKALKEKVEAFWESTGKKYLISIDGRKLFVRSKHSLLNLLFQSAGALSMKYTTIEMCKQFDDMGLLGDPLEHSRDDHKVFMMIVYHDELQLDCPSSVFDIHKFDNEDEAKAFCKANNDSGAPSHVGDEYWCCPDNIVSDVILDSIYQVQTQLKLRVDLGIEWQIGTNWANCH